MKKDDLDETIANLFAAAETDEERQRIEALAEQKRKQDVRLRGSVDNRAARRRAAKLLRKVNHAR